MRRPAGSPTAPFAPLTASSQSPAGAGAALATNIARTAGEGAQRGPHLAISLETADLEINSAGAAALRPPDLPKLWPKAAKSRQVHSFAGPEEMSQKACLRAGETAARSSALSAGCVAAIPRYARPSLGPSVRLYSTLLAAFSSLTSACQGRPCGINTTTRAWRKTAFLGRKVFSQDTFR